MIKRRKREEGVVFVLVLGVIMTLMVLVVSLMSVSVSQVSSSEDEVRRLQAEVLGEGWLGYTLAQGFLNGTVSEGTSMETVGNTTFTLSTNIVGASLPGYQGNKILVRVVY